MGTSFTFYNTLILVIPQFCELCKKISGISLSGVLIVHKDKQFLGLHVQNIFRILTENEAGCNFL